MSAQTPVVGREDRIERGSAYRGRENGRMIPYRNHPHLYEINTWTWLRELSRRSGQTMTLGDVPTAEWDALAAKGFDLIWLMGLWERSPEARRIARLTEKLHRDYENARPGWGADEVVGSPYAIHTYRPDRRLGSWGELDLVRQRLHERGLGLILDFVPNHTAVDHPWVTLSPDYYINFAREPGTGVACFAAKDSQQETRCIAHGKDPYFPAWRDTAQVNHFNPAARRALLEELRRIAAHCDGVRCDMAMLVLNEIFDEAWGAVQPYPKPETEFWSDAIAALPDFIWIAEVYWDRERELQELGFSFTYDKTLYDLLRAGRAPEINRRLARDLPYQGKLVRFLENHDEPRSASVFGEARFPAVGVLFATLPGMRFYHQGQLEGRRIRLPIQLARAQTEGTSRYFLEFYDRILEWTNDTAFHQGAWTLLCVTGAGDASSVSLIAHQWRSASGWKLVAVNLSASTARGMVRLTESPGDHGDKPGTDDALSFLDQLTGRTYQYRAEQIFRDGLYIELGAFGAHLFSVRPL